MQIFFRSQKFGFGISKVWISFMTMPNDYWGKLHILSNRIFMIYVACNQALNSYHLSCHLATGIVPSPFDCYLANRGCKTLHVRMERHMKNALAIAKYLENHRMVTKVIYPGMVSTWQMLKEVTTIRWYMFIRFTIPWLGNKMW